MPYLTETEYQNTMHESIRQSEVNAELLEALTVILRAYKGDAATRDEYFEQICKKADEVIAKARGAK